MLYLLRSYTKDGSILKIGYASDIEKRIYNYTSHNPGVEVLGTKEGELIDEARLHLYFRSFGYGKCMNEWYEDREEVVDGFKNLTVEEINNKLWEKREDVFNTSIFIRKDSLAYLIYSELFPLNYKKGDTERYDGLEILKGGVKIDYEYFCFLEDKFTRDYAERLRSSENNNDILEALDEFNSYGQFTDKMRVLCDHLDIAEIVPYDYSNYLYALGPERIRACQYKKCLLEDELGRKYSVQDNAGSLKSIVQSSFAIGSRYTKAEIKKKIGEIYETLKIKATPKALVILDYFDVREIQISNKETGKRDAGFEIVRVKK